MAIRSLPIKLSDEEILGRSKEQTQEWAAALNICGNPSRIQSHLQQEELLRTKY